MRDDIPPGGTPVMRHPPAGPVEGRASDGVARFLGLPFAEAPVGPLRFAAPRPKVSWKDPRAALRFGPTAAQPERGPTLIPEPTEAGDDILNLNIFAPEMLPDAPLPVLFYIHGGGYFAGCNRSEWYDGAPFVRAGVIVVCPGYRLGVEGFMPVAGAPDNRGLLDWIAALEWVRDNIAAFGGDPSRICIAGQSAGAGAVATLMATPAAKGLFHRAILFSGSIGFAGSMDRAKAFAAGFEAATGMRANATALSDMPRETLLKGFEAGMTDPAEPEPGAGFVSNMIDGLAMQPLAGTASLPVPPAEAIATGASSDIPVLLTATAEEFVFELEPLGDAITPDRVTGALARVGFDAARQARFRAMYPDFSPARLLGQAMTDLVFRAAMLRMARLRRTAAAGTWLAEYRWQSPVTLDGPMRAAHCLDMPFYLDKLALASAHRVLGPNPPASLGARMHRAIVDFVAGSSPGWPAWSEAQRVRVWDWPDADRTDDMSDLADLWG